MFCDQCGKLNRPEARFCRHCGDSLVISELEANAGIDDLPWLHWSSGRQLNLFSVLGTLTTRIEARYLPDGSGFLAMVVLAPGEEGQLDQAILVAVMGDQSFELAEQVQAGDWLFASGALRSWPILAPDGTVRAVNWWLVAEKISYRDTHLSCEYPSLLAQHWPPG